MCQWKFLVFRYRANMSASRAFSAPDTSLIAFELKSLGVLNGASLRDLRSSRFISTVSMVQYLWDMGDATMMSWKGLPLLVPDCVFRTGSPFKSPRAALA